MVVIISCTVFIFLDRCFNNTEAAITTQGSHVSVLCLSLLTGLDTVIKTECNNGALVINSKPILSKDRSCMSNADVFLKSEGFLVDTSEQHSLDISFKNSLKNSVLNDSTLNAALAMSFLLPCRSDFPSGNNCESNTRCFVCDGQETTTYKIHRTEPVNMHFNLLFLCPCTDAYLLIGKYYLETKDVGKAVVF